MNQSGWIAFTDQRPPKTGYANGYLLVTNKAHTLYNKMTHVWLVRMVHYHDEQASTFHGQVKANKGEITAFVEPSMLLLRGLTHWRPAVPEEWSGSNGCDSAYNQARSIVKTLLKNCGPDLCTWGESYPEAYKALQAYQADMIEDVKHQLEKEG